MAESHIPITKFGDMKSLETKREKSKEKENKRKKKTKTEDKENGLEKEKV